MCARYELINLLRFRDSWRFRLAGDADAALWGEDRVDIRPTQHVPAIVPTLDVVGMRWGLIPHWAHDIRMGTKAINARAEGIEDKPFFRGPLRRSRCLIPATAFFEWRQEGTRKVKFRFARRDDDLFCFAGLYDTWRDPQDPEGRMLRSCTLITTTPNELVADYHDRMPVILHPRDEEIWLDPALCEVGAITPLLRPFRAGEMTVRAA
jgi:putative SOS response-associated peptidase YedK